MRKVTILDTTLRDGEQSEGISFTVKDKIKIAMLLDEIGINYVEGGWPLSNPKTTEFFKQMQKNPLKKAKLVAFGSTARAKNKPSKDPNLCALIEAKTPTVSIFGKAWDFHVTSALKISLEKNLELVTESIKFLKKKKKEVIFDAEHFFDGYKANARYALQVIWAAEKAGADIICLCDTNGGSLPSEIEEIIKAVKIKVGTPLGIHSHNDIDTAVANTITAVNEGITHIQGTINGYGERCGNANLVSIIPILKIKMGVDCISSKQLEELTSLSRHISEIANLAHSDHQPFVGESAFAHKGGIHVSAVMKHSKTYEHIKPSLVGNKTRVIVSELSGTSNLLAKAKEYGLNLKKKSPEIKTLLKTLKEMELAGYQFEEGEASFEMMIHRARKNYKRFFSLKGFRVINEIHSPDEQMNIDATIRLNIKGKDIHVAGIGNGPVSALDHALRKSLRDIYPEINEVRLVDYKVRVLDSKEGTSAKVRVIIESTDGKRNWGTVGVSENIIEASWRALIDSYEYKLLKG